MSQILIQQNFGPATLPPGVTVSSIAVSVTDASGAPQSVSLNGAESPPWSTSVTVAPGAGTVTAAPTLSDGSTPTPATASYDTGSTGTPALAPAGLTVTVTAQ